MPMTTQLYSSLKGDDGDRESANDQKKSAAAPMEQTENKNKEILWIDMNS